jgi:hypothetical protein
MKEKLTFSNALAVSGNLLAESSIALTVSSIALAVSNKVKIHPAAEGAKTKCKVKGQLKPDVASITNTSKSRLKR